MGEPDKKEGAVMSEGAARVRGRGKQRSLLWLPALLKQWWGLGGLPYFFKL